MYFYRANKLDPPVWMQSALLDELDNGSLTPTGMDTYQSAEAVDQLLQTAAQHRPEVMEYIKTNQNTDRLTGWNVSKKLHHQITEYYTDFLKTVPDEPKITVTKITSTNSRFQLHIDRLKTASLFCIIRSDHRARTTWYEPLSHAAIHIRETVAHRKNKKRGNIFPDDVKPVAAMWADPWEMMLFDNNSAHSVEEFLPGGIRIALIISFINISHDDLIYYYQRWTDAVQN